jgi:large subunit ribosomal protein L9
MKVILLRDIPRVGNRNEVKDFKEGYAQNVLISKGLAILATPQALAKLTAEKAELDKKKEKEIEAFNKLVSSIEHSVVTVVAKANEKGHLFKQVSAADVAQAILKSAGVEIDPTTIVLGSIKELGEYKVKIKKGERGGEVTINVVR